MHEDVNLLNKRGYLKIDIDLQNTLHTI